MSFKAYLASGFEHIHENELFHSLVHALNERFGANPAPHFLIGNVMFDGEELDAVFLKPDAISVIEMKSHGGMIHFSENTEWFADEREVRGGRHPNPFRQVRAYRFALMGRLERLQKEILSTPRTFGWGQISGVVLFGKPIIFDERLPQGVGLWFHISDLDHVGDTLANLHSPKIQFTESELECFLKIHGFQERHLYSGALQPSIDTKALASDAGGQAQTRIVYHKESNFRDHEMRMRNAGGARSAGAMRLRQLFDEVRQGRDSFLHLDFAESKEVPGARVYPLNEVCLLVMFHAGRNLYPFYRRRSRMQRRAS